MYIYLVPLASQSLGNHQESTFFYLQDKGDIMANGTRVQPTDDLEKGSSALLDSENLSELSEEEKLGILQSCGSACNPEDIKLFTRYYSRLPFVNF